MDRFAETELRFRTCLRRARGVCELQEYLATRHSAALDTSDMLRAAVVLCVSAFDFMVHELYRVEVLFRFKNGKLVRRFHVPFQAAIAQSEEVESLLETHVRAVNSYKSFVEPAKFAEAMVCFIDAPWERIAAKMGMEADAVKSRVRSVYRWRNRIAHEADINPVLGGIALFPIIKADVIDAIADFERIGLAAIEVLRES